MITAERARDLLSYNPETGVFTWKMTRRGVAAGKVAGTVDKKGYRIIWLDRKAYRASRLAWLMMTGQWPAREIDHKNRNRGDDSFKNLRPASRAEQTRNRGPVANSVSGLKGVSWHIRGKWVARIGFGGKRINLGYFDDPQIAAAAYREAELKYFGQFARAA